MRLANRFILIGLALIAALTSSAQYVQPMRYDHYSIPQQANVGAGVVRVTAPSAYFEIGPTLGGNKGFLAPRLSTTERNAIASPADGLLIYNVTTKKFNYYDSGSSSWKDIGSGTGAAGITQLGSSPWGLLSLDDSTYVVDSTEVLTKYQHEKTRDSLAAIISSISSAIIRFDSSYTPMGGIRSPGSYIVKSVRIRRNNITVNPTQIGDSLMYWNIDVPTVDSAKVIGNELMIYMTGTSDINAHLPTTTLDIDSTHEPLAGKINDSLWRLKSLRLQFGGTTIPPTVDGNKISWNITGVAGNDSAYIHAYLTADSTALVLVRDNGGQDTFHFRVDTTGWNIPNIYNSDGSLTGTRTLNGLGYRLTFDELSGFDVNSSDVEIQLNYTKAGKAAIFILGDTTKLLPNNGLVLIDSLREGASSENIVTWNPTTKLIGQRSLVDTTTVPLITFSAGAGFAADTAMVTDSSLFGSVFTGQYEYTIKGVQAVIKGNTGDSIVLKIVYNDSFNIDGTKINGAGISLNNRYTGNSFTVTVNRTVAVNSWLWVKPEAVIAGKKPKYISVTLLGYKTYIAP